MQNRSNVLSRFFKKKGDAERASLRGPAFIVLGMVLFYFTHSGPGTLIATAGGHPCCSDDPELSYLLFPKPSQKFQYRVLYETFFSRELGKEKGFFVILPEGFNETSPARFPVLFLLHGYNFHRNGLWWKVTSPEKAKAVLCQVREEEYHWLLHEDIAVLAAALMDPKNRSYRELMLSMEERFEELSRYGGLAKGDYAPKEIALSVVSHNLHPGDAEDPYSPIRPMILILPDGDNGFYTDENQGRSLFPETRERRGCDGFLPGEAYSHSLLPFLRMKPGALGKHESYFLELVRHLESHPSYRGRILPGKGIGGISMGGYGAMKFGLKYPRLFRSASSQSGLLDLDQVKNKWMLKMLMPEFLEVFGRLEPTHLPTGSTLDEGFIRANNPTAIALERKWSRLPTPFYFDYGEKEGYSGITEGNRSFERATGGGDRQVPIQPFNGKAGHNYRFWRSRLGVVLKHHSDQLGGE